MDSELPGDARELPTTGKLSMSQVLELSDPLRQFINWLMRQKDGVRLEDVVAYTGQDAEAARAMLTSLSVKGYIRAVLSEEVPHYQIWFTPSQRRGGAHNIWNVFADPDLPSGES